VYQLNDKKAIVASTASIVMTIISSTRVKAFLRFLFGVFCIENSKKIIKIKCRIFVEIQSQIIVIYL
jgi:hypothetical protein